MEVSVLCRQVKWDNVMESDTPSELSGKVRGGHLQAEM